MRRISRRADPIEHDNVHRWLVSYADYMTLLFALFVVLYAMAMVNEEPFETITESIGRVFQANNEKTKNKGHGDDILPVNSAKTNIKLYGNGILDIAGPELVDGEKDLTNIEQSQVGSNLNTLETQLQTALFDIIDSGYAQLHIDGDWLEIELNSGLLFASGSASATKAAHNVLLQIADIIGSARNFVRVRGYTDNQPINTEVFSSNWELSVARATAILRVLEELGVTPQRMAIEGYGQYYPSDDNTHAQGRSKNRKVVIALSKYGLNTQIEDTQAKTSIDNQNVVEEEKINKDREENNINVISLENGGIRITTRDEKAK